MGEAKQRKKDDPFYGRVPKGGRGIILTTPIVSDDEASELIFSFSLNPFELRRAVLFWDKIAFPRSMLFSSDSADVDFLVAEGLMIRPWQRFPNPNIMSTSDFGESILNTFIDLEKESPGTWSLAQGDNALRLKGSSFPEQRGLLVDLYRAIPVPDHDVALEDIIDFKLKRRDEVVSLRIELDEFYQNVLQSEDPHHQVASSCNRIEAKCRDLMRVQSEFKLPFVVSDWQINFSTKDAPVGAGIGALVGSMFELEGLGALAGAATSALSISIGAGLNLGNKKTDEGHAFRYVASMQNKL